MYARWQSMRRTYPIKVASKAEQLGKFPCVWRPQSWELARWTRIIRKDLGARAGQFLGPRLVVAPRLRTHPSDMYSASLLADLLGISRIRDMNVLDYD